LDLVRFVNANLLSGGNDSLIGHKDLVIRINLHTYQAYYFRLILEESRVTSLPTEVPCRRNFTGLPDQQGCCGARVYTGRLVNFPLLCPLCEGLVNLHQKIEDKLDQDRSCSIELRHLKETELLHKQSFQGVVNIQTLYKHAVAFRRGEYAVRRPSLAPLPTSRNVNAHSTSAESFSDCGEDEESFEGSRKRGRDQPVSSTSRGFN
jgi:hypothetical protein